MIEKWNGFINIWFTDFQDLAFLRSLTFIQTSFSNYPIDDEDLNKAATLAVFYIYNNPNLTSFGIPNLSNVFADVLPITRRVYGLHLDRNEELCLSESDFWKLRKMERSFMYGMKICGPVKKQYCYSTAFLHSNMPLGCQVLLNGIWLRDVTNTSYQAHLNQAYSTVEEIHGPIVIFRTEFTNLSFPVLHTIRSQYYDGQNDWQWQIIIIRGNFELKSIDFPNLGNFTHYGKEPFVTNSNNFVMKYTKRNCDLFRSLPFFSVTDEQSGCGLIPLFDNGQWTAWLIIQVGEKVLVLFINFLFCFNLIFKLFKSKITINLFHFASIFLILLTMVECLYVNTDYVQIFDNKGFAIPCGFRSLLIGKNELLFNQISNNMYANRLAFLVSCSFLRPLYLMGLVHQKVGIFLSAVVFFVANIGNLLVMEALEYRYLYIIFPMNWLAVLITFASGFFVKYAFKKHFPDDVDLVSEHNKASVGFFLQAFLTFVFCGYSDGLNQFIRNYTKYIWMVHYYDKLFYWYGGIVMRWHYTVILYALCSYVEHFFAKLPTRTTNVSDRSSTIAIAN